MPDGTVDQVALERFGIRLSIPRKGRSSREETQAVLRADGQYETILERPSEKTSRRTFYGLSFIPSSPDLDNLAKRWVEDLNGPIESYLSCSEQTVAIQCLRAPKSHGVSIVTMRLFWQGLRCWNCLARHFDASLAAGSRLVSETPYATEWSPLNGVVRPDMVPALSTSFAALWRCPRCRTEWYIEPGNRRRCEGCKARVSAPEVQTYLALRQLLDASSADVELGRVIATGLGSATDIVITHEERLVCIEYDGSRAHSRPGIAEREMRKDAQVHALGGVTIRLREGMAEPKNPGSKTKRLGPSTFPHTMDLPTRTRSDLVFQMWPHLAERLQQIGVPCPSLSENDAKSIHIAKTAETRRIVERSVDWRTSANPDLAPVS